MGKSTESHIKASKKYNDKTYELTDILLKRGQEDIIKDAALLTNKSQNQFIKDAINIQLQKDGIDLLS